MNYYQFYIMLTKFNDILFTSLYVLGPIIVYNYISNYIHNKIDELQYQVESLQNSLSEIKKNYINEVRDLHNKIITLENTLENTMENQKINNTHIISSIKITERNLVSFIHCLTRNINISKVPKYKFLNSKIKDPNYMEEFLEIFKNNYNSDVRGFIDLLENDDKMDILQDKINNVESNHYVCNMNKYEKMKKYKNPTVRYLAINHIYDDNLLKYLDSNL